MSGCLPCAADLKNHSLVRVSSVASKLSCRAPALLPLPQGFAARRALVCAYLGIGNCDGKQLLRQLNTYGFQLADLKEAMLWARDQLQQQEGGRQQQQEKQRGEQQPQLRQQRGTAR